MPSLTNDAFDHAFVVDLTIGSLEVGALITSCLFGVTCVQTYLYFRHLKADPWGMVLLVFAVWLLDLGHTIAVSHLIYTLTITNYGAGVQSFIVPPVSIDVTILLSAFIGTIEQAWFIRRLYVFSKNIYLTGICVTLTLARFIGSLGLSVVVFHRITLPEYVTRFSWLVTSIMATAAANDVLLAAFLTYCLNRTKTRAFASGMSKLLNKLTFIAVESGLITSIGAVAVLVTLLTMPLNSVYMALFVILGKLYSNAFLASLNAHRSFVNDFRDPLSVHNSDFPPTMSTTGSPDPEAGRERFSRSLAATVPFTSPFTSLFSSNETGTGSRSRSHSPTHWRSSSCSQLVQVAVMPSSVLLRPGSRGSEFVMGMDSRIYGSGIHTQSAGSDHASSVIHQIMVTTHVEKFTEDVDEVVNHNGQLDSPKSPTSRSSMV
ncbi:hypothetical protein D9758_007273 [Tetrapyrgos nigripes]|uniref:DUF6534 domain-containing protein n=1 Tax=Tetrapyrgos nigripes TaxID=182062 RepID=A0A8H5GB17_9AGAR|nr:hypothetical protein D9758_007273 [Tetrapyrgos nigripes]